MFISSVKSGECHVCCNKFWIFLVVLGDISLLVFRMCHTFCHYGLDEFRKRFIPIVPRLVDWFLACFDRLFVEI